MPCIHRQQHHRSKRRGPPSTLAEGGSGIYCPDRPLGAKPVNTGLDVLGCWLMLTQLSDQVGSRFGHGEVLVRSNSSRHGSVACDLHSSEVHARHIVRKDCVSQRRVGPRALWDRQVRFRLASSFRNRHMRPAPKS
jgi:hypothetical protein